MKKTFYLAISFAIFSLGMAGCQKMDKPSLGDYLQDTNPADGPLRFYAALDGTGSDNLRNAVDSIKANFPSSNSMSPVAGASGSAMQGGSDGKTIVYPSANDFNKATSLTISFWMKNTDAGRTEFLFSLVDEKYGWSNSGIFLMLEHGNATETTLKFGLMDQWLEWPDSKKFPRPLMDGNWHHLALVYDEVTSKMAYYFDGLVVPDAPDGAVHVKNGGNPRGALDLTGAKKLIIGGWNKHGGAKGPTDDWIKSFTGSIDQFRLYNKALSAAEVQALFTNKQ